MGATNSTVTQVPASTRRPLPLRPVVIIKMKPSSRSAPGSPVSTAHGAPAARRGQIPALAQRMQAISHKTDDPPMNADVPASRGTGTQVPSRASGSRRAGAKPRARFVVGFLRPSIGCPRNNPSTPTPSPGR
eukprot:2737508-Pyramimonas_sp.AAC.2